MATPRRPVIAVVGDAKLSETSPAYILTHNIGQALVEAGYRVLTGGLGGVMEAALRGARSSRLYAPGDTIGVLPGFDPDDANQFADVIIPTGLDHARNSIVASADALVAVGGGAGTLSEICFAWMHNRLIIGMRVDGWSCNLADQRVDQRQRYPEIPDDRVYGANTEKDVIATLEMQLPRYQRRHHGIRRRE